MFSSVTEKNVLSYSIQGWRVVGTVALCQVWWILRGMWGTPLVGRSSIELIPNGTKLGSSGMRRAANLATSSCCISRLISQCRASSTRTPTNSVPTVDLSRKDLQWCSIFHVQGYFPVKTVPKIILLCYNG